MFFFSLVDEASCGKKTRQCFTSKQVEELERLFNETNYPDAYTRQMLAKKMNVSETRIQVNIKWLNKRLNDLIKKYLFSFNPKLSKFSFLDKFKFYLLDLVSKQTCKTSKTAQTTKTNSSRTDKLSQLLLPFKQCMVTTTY